MYEYLISSLRIFMTTIPKIHQGYLLPKIFTSSKIKTITDSDFSMSQKAIFAYILTLPHMTHCYGMKLITLGINEEHSLVINFPLYVKAFNGESPVPCETEPVPVPINDINEAADSYHTVTISHLI